MLPIMICSYPHTLVYNLCLTIVKKEVCCLSLKELLSQVVEDGLHSFGIHTSIGRTMRTKHSITEYSSLASEAE